MLKFSITKESKSKYLYKPLIIAFVIDIIVVIGMTNYYDESFSTALFFFIIIIIFHSILITIPLVILYSNYFKNDKNISFSIINEGESFIYQNKNIEIRILKDDIEKVIFYLSPGLYRNGLTWLYWDDFFYSEIVTNNKTFRVSCLVIDTLKEFIEKEKIERRLIYFPIIKDRLINIDKSLIIPNDPIERFKLKFKDKTQDELEEMIKYSKNYQKDAVEAARILLNEKDSSL